MQDRRAISQGYEGSTTATIDRISILVTRSTETQVKI
jgi:hypothetical protein